MNEQLLLDAIQRSHDDLKDLVEAKVGAVEDKVDNLVKRMDKMNGNVARLQEESNNRLEVVNDFRRLEKEFECRKKWPRRNLLYIIMGGVFFVVAIVVLYDMIGIAGLLELIK